MDRHDEDTITQVAELFTRTFRRMRRGTAKELAPLAELIDSLAKK